MVIKEIEKLHKILSVSGGIGKVALRSRKGKESARMM